MVIVTGIDDFIFVDGNIAIIAGIAADHLVEVLGDRAAVFPNEVASNGINGLYDVVCLGYV